MRTDYILIISINLLMSNEISPYCGFDRYVKVFKAKTHEKPCHNAAKGLWRVEGTH